MDPVLESWMTQFPDGDRAVDEIGCAAIAKWEQASIGKAVGTLTDVESTIANVWGAYSLAINGGTTEVVSCVDCDALLSALEEVGWPAAAAAVSRLRPLILAAEAELKGLSSEEGHAKWFALKDGEWRPDDGVFYRNEGQAETLLWDYIRKHCEEIHLDHYLKRPPRGVTRPPS